MLFFSICAQSQMFVTFFMAWQISNRMFIYSFPFQEQLALSAEMHFPPVKHRSQETK